MRIQSVARFGLAALVGGVAILASAQAHAATSCNPDTLTCVTGTADGLKGQIKQKLATEIDSGWMEKGPIKVRTRFTIDPVGSDPLAAVSMEKGALVEASWPEKGYVSLKPLTGDGASGAMNVHFTLTPSLDANIYGIGVSYDASSLVNMIPGASFHYDSTGSTTSLLPWGFAGADAKANAPNLDQSTIFSIGFDKLGIDSGVAEGTLAIQASAKPTFHYTTKSVRFDSETVTTADGVAKLPVGDADSLDITAYVSGEVALLGSLDVKPVVQIDSVDGYPTFGLTKFSFSAVSKDLAENAKPTSIAFDKAVIHVPLPNVKVPSTPLDMGSAQPGQSTTKSVSIDSTGELDALLTITSSDPQFVVPSGQVRVKAKSKYDLAIAFKPSGGPASADITVRSNDPDAPEQTFHVAANGASLNPDDPSSDASGEHKQGHDTIDPPSENSGCSASSSSRGTTPGLASLLGILGVAFLARRRRAR